jgi:hypothetical protein
MICGGGREERIAHACNVGKAGQQKANQSKAEPKRMNRRGHERAAHGGAGRHADKRNE